MEKFTIKQFNDKYPDDDACLNELFQQRYGDLTTCPKCQKETKFHRVKGRKCYKCQYCAFELHPLADTIFHKSSTSLKNWFLAIYLFANSKNGVAAMELQRHLGVTYKTAWRMAKQIRTLFQDQDLDNKLLCNVVEVDEAYMGGKRRGKKGRSAEGKTPVIGIVERGGEVKAVVAADASAATILPLLCNNVEGGSRVISDTFASYRRVSLNGFKHQTINHSKGQYAIGDVHTNTIEGFWGQLKRSVNGTYHSVSPKYLQSYVDEFAYRYNHRRRPEHLFRVLIPMAARLV